MIEGEEPRDDAEALRRDHVSKLYVELAKFPTMSSLYPASFM